MKETARTQWTKKFLVDEVLSLRNQLAASKERETGLVDLLTESQQFCLKVDCDGDNLNIGLARRIQAALAAASKEEASEHKDVPAP